MPEMIRILDVVTPLTSNSELRFDLVPDGGDEEPWIAFVTSSNEYALFLRMKDRLARVDSGTRYRGEWSPGPSTIRPIGAIALDRGAVPVTVRFVDGRAEIRWSDAPPLQIPLSEPTEAIVRIDGVGAWRHIPAARPSGAAPLTALPNAKAPLRMQANLVFDIGMHAGLDTDFYLKKGFRVVAVEANPILAGQVAERFASAIESEQLTIVNLGLAPKAGELPFYVNRVRTEWSSFDQNIASRGDATETITVGAVTPAELFAAFGVPYFLKVDIEGYDRYVIEALSSLADRPRYVSVENGEQLLIDLLRRAGYAEFKYVDQSKVPEARLPRPPLEGIPTQHIFLPGSSGPFGEETTGEWFDAANLAPPVAADAATWFDLHARLPTHRSHRA